MPLPRCLFATLFFAEALAPRLVGAAPVNLTTAHPQVALTEFDLEGEGASPALALQLQDGFVVGLFRAGIPVLDPVDVARRLPKNPELQRCDTSPCLKNLGQLLDIRFVMRVKVSLTGNSYKMAVRLFTTEGAVPAALPVEAQSRFCDVCTVTEAREVMIRLADGIKKPLDEAPTPPPPARRPRTHTWSGPSIVSVALGVASVFAGAAVLAASGDDAGKGPPALAGGLMGAGLVVATYGLYMGFDPPAGPGVRW